MSHNISYNPNLLPRIDVMGEAYELPLLGKHRRIAVMLPHDYDDHPDKRYPVLYLQDGQNLYEDSAPFGTWGVNKRLAFLAGEGMGDVIVVAIDHAEEYRIKEFLPFQHPKFGKGEGDKYVSFIADELKPHIDANYRTMPERTHTGIGGSSMGGLITLHAGFQRSDLFSKLMVFSPSLWVSKKIYDEAAKYKPKEPCQVYLYAGGNESRALLPNLQKLCNVLEQYADKKPDLLSVKLSVNPVGTHSEYFWGEAFPEALEALYFQ